MAFQNLHLATWLDIFLKKGISQELTPDRLGKKVQQFVFIKCRKSLLFDKRRYKETDLQVINAIRIRNTWSPTGGWELYLGVQQRFACTARIGSFERNPLKLDKNGPSRYYSCLQGSIIFGYFIVF